MDYLNLLKEREKEKCKKERLASRITTLKGKTDAVNNPERVLEDLNALHMLISQQFESKPKDAFTIGGEDN